MDNISNKMGIEEKLRKRLWIFAGICLSLAGMSKLLYLKGLTLPNMELVIPVLVVAGSTYLWGVGETEKKLGKTFGLFVLGGVVLVDLLFWGLHRIYLFTWSGFLMVWWLATRNKLSPLSGFWRLVGKTTLTAAIAILLFDFWTGIIGSPLTGFYGPLTSLSTWFTAFLLQVPFTLYHLSSLFFVPPLVGLLKLSTKIRLEVPIPIRVGASVSTTERR